MLAVLLAGFGGCTRRFFRQRADNEVAAILKEKDVCPQWKLENYHAYPDPRARFADTTDPDHPPMPPDDPAAANLAPRPQKPGKPGIARVEGTGYLDLLRLWDAQNRGTDPTIAQCAADDQALRPFLLTLEQAAELGLINSREFQTRRENVYLTALPVTLERFAFAAQFFALDTAIREWAGRESAVGSRNRWQSLSSAGFSKLFSTGALLLVRFANDTVVNLTGKDRHTVSTSTINLDFVQPFLRGGGKAVTLEPLTQVERNLVYELRSYARFRKQFYTFVAGGFDLPSLAGAFGRVGGSAISPGAVAASGANIPSPQLNPGAAGRIDLSLVGLAPAEGFLPNLLRAALLTNEQKNVASLEQYLDLFKFFERAGRIPPLQVSQVLSQLLQSRSTVLQRELDLRNGLDNFKLQLGLPVNVPLQLDQAAIRPILEHFKRYEDVFSQFTASMEQLKKISSPNEGTRMRERLQRLLVEAPIVQKTKFRESFLARWQQWAPERIGYQELEPRLRLLKQQRSQLVEQKEKRIEDEGKSFTPAEEGQIRRLDEQIEAGELEVAVRRYQLEPWKNLPEELALNLVMALASDPDRALAVFLRDLIQTPDRLPLSPEIAARLQEEVKRRRKQLHGDRFQRLSDAFELVLNEARRERFDPLREQWPNLPPVELNGRNLLDGDLDETLQAVVRTALTDRLDLMNTRAVVTDAWRQLAIFANALLGTFDVAYHLDGRTPPNQAKPLAFSGSRTRHQLIFNTELPLVRKVERNNYRASLIAYQRERRNLMAVEDQIANAVRSELRSLRVLLANYKIQQRAVDLAYQQVENALEAFNAPPEPGGKQNDPVALTNQLLQQQASLVRQQNQLYTFWINFLLTRLQLYLDLELMPVDPRGVWIDELATRERPAADTGTAGPGRQPPAGGERDGRPERLPEPRPLPAPAAPPLE